MTFAVVLGPISGRVEIFRWSRFILRLSRVILRWGHAIFRWGWNMLWGILFLVLVHTTIAFAVLILLHDVRPAFTAGPALVHPRLAPDLDILNDLVRAFPHATVERTSSLATTLVVAGLVSPWCMHGGNCGSVRRDCGEQHCEEQKEEIVELHDGW